MDTVFGPHYAHAYDNLYRDKDYDGEVALLQRIFHQYGPPTIRRVLDLGCGTGNHAVRLAKLGYDVTGVDQSREMLALAEAKGRAQQVRLTVHHSRVTEFNLPVQFDAVLLMFAVLGYHTTNAEVLGALATARRQLVPGGLLVFDVWYGPAVLAQRPGERVRVLDRDAGTTIRATLGTLDTRTHTCRVDYRLWELTGDRVTGRTSESHFMRYFFPQELELFLKTTGFELQRLGAFPDLDREPSEQTWNVLAIARAA
jgi:SAM-dependent methyltransferase